MNDVSMLVTRTVCEFRVTDVFTMGIGVVKEASTNNGH